MESSPSSSTPTSSYGVCLIVFLLRPALAIAFVLSFIALWWFLAWKLVLVHVPLVQEIFGLRKKTVRPKPETRRRFSRFYNSIGEGGSRLTGIDKWAKISHLQSDRHWVTSPCRSEFLVSAFTASLSIDVPTIHNGYFSGDGDFVLRKVWNQLKPTKPKVGWAKIVWFRVGI